MKGRIIRKAKSNIRLLNHKGKAYLIENEEVEILMEDNKGYYILLNNGLKAWFDKNKFKEM